MLDRKRDSTEWWQVCLDTVQREMLNNASRMVIVTLYLRKSMQYSWGRASSEYAHEWPRTYIQTFRGKCTLKLNGIFHWLIYFCEGFECHLLVVFLITGPFYFFFFCISKCYKYDRSIKTTLVVKYITYCTPTILLLNRYLHEIVTVSYKIKWAMLIK